MVRPERFELPASWFVGRNSIIRKSMIRMSNHYANRLIFPPDMPPLSARLPWVVTSNMGRDHDP